jgi:hypothetical protein
MDNEELPNSHFIKNKSDVEMEPGNSEAIYYVGIGFSLIRGGQKRKMLISYGNKYAT